jgi:hypothetical protein
MASTRESVAEESRGVSNRGLPPKDRTITPREAAQIEAARLKALAAGTYRHPDRTQSERQDFEAFSRQHDQMSNERHVWRFQRPDGSTYETSWKGLGTGSTAQAFASAVGDRVIGEVIPERTPARDAGVRGREPRLTPPPLVQAGSSYSQPPLQAERSLTPPPLVEAEPPFTPPPLVQAETPLGRSPRPRPYRIDDHERGIVNRTRGLTRSAIKSSGQERGLEAANPRSGIVGRGSTESVPSTKVSVVTFWLNAFIPKTVPGYTKVLTGGPYKGKSVVPLPRIARLHFLNAQKAQDVGYLTDQRTFDTSVGASVRMQSWAEVNVSSIPFMSDQNHTTTGTTEVDISSGDHRLFKKANMSKCIFRPVSSSPSTLTLSLEASASDPLVGAAAEIDYEGMFTISRGERPGSLVVSFNGKIDDFPAFECYASFNGKTKTIFQSPPPSGNTVENLFGRASRPVAENAEFP